MDVPPFNPGYGVEDRLLPASTVFRRDTDRLHLSPRLHLDGEWCGD